MIVPHKANLLRLAPIFSAQKDTKARTSPLYDGMLKEDQSQ
jgi:hypothetical protein